MSEFSSTTNMNSDTNSNITTFPTYSGHIGLGDSERQDSSLYTEQVDFDFFDDCDKLKTSAIVDETDEGAAPPTPAITTNFHPETNSLLQVQIANTAAEGGEGETSDKITLDTSVSGVTTLTTTGSDGQKTTVPFSTELLMAALQDTPCSTVTAMSDNLLTTGTGQQDTDNIDTQKPRFRLFDLTDSSSDEDEEAELAEINKWSSDIYGYGRKCRQKSRHHETARSDMARYEVAFIENRPVQINGEEDNFGAGCEEISDDDDEGYYLTESDLSDLTDITPMSSVAASPMPPFGSGSLSNTGTPFKKDEFDGYLINRPIAVAAKKEKLKSAAEDEDDDVGHGDELEDDDDEDIEQLLKIIPSSATIPLTIASSEDENGGSLPFPQTYDNAQDIRNKMGTADTPNKKRSNFLIQIGASTEEPHLDPILSGTPCYDGVEMPLPSVIVSSAAIADNCSNSITGLHSEDETGLHHNEYLLTKYCAKDLNGAIYDEAHKAKKIPNANAHHHHHLRLNRVHHHNNWNNGHIGHGHHFHNNYHQQYHNLTMALQRKRQNQLKQIEHDNSILKRKIQNVKPSTDIMKAFNCSNGPINTSASSTTTTAVTPGTIAGCAGCAGAGNLNRRKSRKQQDKQQQQATSSLSSGSTPASVSGTGSGASSVSSKC